jgi:hypothetical protein
MSFVRHRYPMPLAEAHVIPYAIHGKDAEP